MSEAEAPNATAAAFGFPQTVVRDYDNWVVLTRPHQCTLGAVVLVCKNNARAFSALSAAAYSELQLVTADIETGLALLRPFKKINYLMLMMKDPDVHFHVVPRYDAEQSFAGLQFADTGWPGIPDLGGGHLLPAGALVQLTQELIGVWPGSAK